MSKSSENEKISYGIMVVNITSMVAFLSFADTLIFGMLNRNLISGSEKRSLRKLAHVIYRFFSAVKTEKFHWKNFDITNIFAQNIDCRYTLESPRRGSSNEYPKSMFWTKNKKKGVPMHTPVLLYNRGYTFHIHEDLFCLFDLLLNIPVNSSGHVRLSPFYGTLVSNIVMS